MERGPVRHLDAKVRQPVAVHVGRDHAVPRPQLARPVVEVGVADEAEGIVPRALAVGVDPVQVDQVVLVEAAEAVPPAQLCLLYTSDAADD